MDSELLEELRMIEGSTEMDRLGFLINQINEMKGWNTINRSEGDWASLAHSEISEAFKSFRNNEKLVWFNEDGKPEGAAIEYADAMIRILHWFNRRGINPMYAIATKIRYNISRPQFHGGKAM